MRINLDRKATSFPAHYTFSNISIKTNIQFILPLQYTAQNHPCENAPIREINSRFHFRLQ